MTTETTPMGMGVKATYHHEVVPIYDGNPLIEALPPIWTEADVRDRLWYQPAYDPQMRAAPTHLRAHLIMAAAHFFRPLPVHLALEQRISCMLRAGYVNRNPLVPGYWPQLGRTVETFQRQLGLVPHVTTTQGFSIVGMSGVGKSTSVRRILSCYDQVIVHKRYQRKLLTHVQLVWLLLQCPRNGALSDLVRQFFQVLDQVLGTDYYRQFVVRSNRRIEEFIPDMANLAARHSLGVLVIDEVQNLMHARGQGAEELLNFLVEIDNMIGIPVVLIGTTKALPILMQEFRRARRAAGQGDLLWDRMQENAIWEQLLKTLWTYQFIRKETPLTPVLSHALYDASQGITDLAVKVYLLAQIHAMASGTEDLTPDLFDRVIAENLRLVQPFLAALRANDRERLKHFDDIQPLDMTISLITGIYDNYRVQASSRELAREPAPSPSAEDGTAPPISVPGGTDQPIPQAMAATDAILADIITGVSASPPKRRKRLPTPAVETPLLVTWYTQAVAHRRPIYTVLQEAGLIADLRTELALPATTTAPMLEAVSTVNR